MVSTHWQWLTASNVNVVTLPYPTHSTLGLRTHAACESDVTGILYGAITAHRFIRDDVGMAAVFMAGKIGDIAVMATGENGDVCEANSEKSSTSGGG